MQLYKYFYFYEKVTRTTFIVTLPNYIKKVKRNFTYSTSIYIKKVKVTRTAFSTILSSYIKKSKSN